jgi:SAM-dependent methyltransferase
MTHSRLLRCLLALGFLLALAAPLATPSVAQTPDTTTSLPFVTTTDTVDSDVPYVPTSPEVVERMLEVANVSSEDVVYDLGSGDGRFPITAAKRYGARGVGVEIDPKLVRESRANAREAGVTDLVEFRQGDMFEADLSDATVVTLYLFPEINIRLRPKLFAELDPGDRVVSHDFDMDEWEPDRVINMGNDTIYFWTIPEENPEWLEEQ